MIVKKFVPDPKDIMPAIRKDWNDWCWKQRPKIRTLLKKAARAIMDGDEQKARKLTWEALEAIIDFDRAWMYHGPQQNLILKE